MEFLLYIILFILLFIIFGLFMYGQHPSKSSSGNTIYIAEEEPVYPYYTGWWWPGNWFDRYSDNYRYSYQRMYDNGWKKPCHTGKCGGTSGTSGGSSSGGSSRKIKKMNKFVNNPIVNIQAPQSQTQSPIQSQPEPFVEVPADMTQIRSINNTNISNENTQKQMTAQIQIQKDPIPTIDVPPFASHTPSPVVEKVPVQIKTPEVILPKQLDANLRSEKIKMD
jgi:hypothetical protein